MKTLWLLTIALGFSSGFARAAAATNLKITKAGNGVNVEWNTEAGNDYQVESAATLQGPWQKRTELTASVNTLSWPDTELAGVSQRFYRVALIASAVPKATFLAADSVADDTGTLGLYTSDIGAKAVFLASQLGAGGQQLLTTGTLTEQGQNWNYAPTPTDRLLVQFQSGTNLNYYVTRMEGTFSGDAANFLQQPHVFNYRVTSPPTMDLTFTTEIPSGTCNFAATARGTLAWGGVTYTLDLTLAGQYCFESGFGYYSLLNDYRTTGTVTAPGFNLRVDQRRRFELITSDRDSSSSEEEWNNNTLTVGADTFKWDNTKKQKSFKNGKPSSIDEYWQAHGAVLKNGAAFGTYRRDASAVLQIIKFVLVLPDDVVDLETWQVL